MPFAPPQTGGETRAIPAVGFEPSSPATTQQFTPPAPAEEDSPWGSPAPMGGETKAFPKMSFDDMKKLAEEKAPAAAAFSEHNDDPFGAPPAAEQFSGETRAFPKMNFDDLQKLAAEPSPAPAPPEPPPAEESPWGAPPAMGETRAFPQMNFEQLSKAAEESEQPGSTSPWDEPSAPAAPAWGSTPEPEVEEPAPEAPAWAAPSAPPVTAPVAAAASSTGGNGLDLTDDQVDRIARRVIQLMSDQVVRNIAWEVIPDMAEMVVKERIRQLESEG